MTDHRISARARNISASGIRRVFDLAATLNDPINLSIGQPNFETPEPVREAICDAVRAGKNGYSPTQGIRPLLDRLQGEVDRRYQHADRRLFVTSGTSGGLMLAIAALVDPGDEVIFFDPYFVMYQHLTTLFGGVPVPVDTYPDFKIDIEKLKASITPRTKLIIFNSPANPTGAVPGAATVKALAELAASQNIVLLSDEIYRTFTYDGDFRSPAEWNPQTLVIDGFSKTYSMTGLRCGWAHGPAAIIEQMLKIQQYTFVCAPHPVQWGAVAACDVDLSAHVVDYRRKRDYMVQSLAADYEIGDAGGAFYLFVKAPGGSGQAFAEAAVQENLLVIPGGVFSSRDTHFRISYAADDATLARGVAALKQLADRFAQL